MKKVLIVVAVLVGLGVLVKRFAPDFGKIDWEKKFESMPDNAPPKWMFRNITAIRENTERIIELLEGPTEEQWRRTPRAGQRWRWRRSRRADHVKVLTVYAHHDPRSFCHGVLERFTAGLTDAGHTSDVVDLYAIKFDPVFRERDVASYIAGDIPDDILELMNLSSGSCARAVGRSSASWRRERCAASRARRSPP